MTTKVSPLSALLTMMSLFFFKVRSACASFFEILGMYFVCLLWPKSYLTASMLQSIRRLGLVAFLHLSFSVVRLSSMRSLCVLEGLGTKDRPLLRSEVSAFDNL